MKRSILGVFILSAVFFMVFSVRILSASGVFTLVEWINPVCDLGEIEKNKPVEAAFEFTNKGQVPLILQSAEGSCGCTGVKFSKKPIFPGVTAKITATFDAAKEGLFHKTVTVKANTRRGSHILQLKGKVLPSPKP